MPDKKKILDSLSSKLAAQYEELLADIKSVQESVNSEVKSSAGDKHETGRAMGQIEVERMSGLLRNLENDLRLLKGIDPEHRLKSADLGAVILLEDKSLFISVGAGRFIACGKEYIAISAQSPIATQIRGKLAGDMLTMAGVELAIKDIY